MSQWENAKLPQPGITGYACSIYYYKVYSYAVYFQSYENNHNPDSTVVLKCSYVSCEHFYFCYTASPQCLVILYIGVLKEH